MSQSYKIFLIYSFNDYGIQIHGYIKGAAKEAKEYCKKVSGNIKVYYEEINELRES